MLSTKEIKENVQDTKTARGKKQFSYAEAKQIGEALGIAWDKFDVEQFTMGLNVELEHGRRDPATDVTHDRPIVTGKIALAHLNEFPDYYTRLAVMEHEAERAKSMQRKGDLAEQRVVVGKYTNEIDAEIAKGHLESSGIPASIIKDDGGGMLPSLQNTEGVQLVVAETQSDEAKKILPA